MTAAIDRRGGASFERQLQAAIRETVATGRSLTAVCLSCGSTIAATVGGSLPVGAMLVAGDCISIPGKGYRHTPEVWWQGGRIR